MSPPSDDEIDRERILARRALFVTTAIAALGCSSQGTPAGSGSVGSTASAPSAAPTASASAQTSTGLRPWADVERGHPPIDVAASLPEPDKAELTALKQRLTPAYAALKSAWEAPVAGCGPKACEDAWRAAAKAIHEALDAVRPSLCGRETSVGSLQRAAAHRRRITALSSELQAALGDVALRLGDATTWPQMVQSLAQPQPCLKCAIPPEPGVLEGGEPVEIAFASGASDLGTAAVERLASLQKPEQRIVVRGHADPGEPGDLAKLSLARAEAVRGWLVKNGVRAADVTVVGLGADLTIESTTTEAGRARNRRVDLALVADRAP